MAATTFGWFPDAASEATEEPKVTATKLGDGYEQRSANTINSSPESWSLTFTKTRTEALAIRAFLRARGALQAFNWTTPFGEQGVFVCRKWKCSPDRGKLTVTCTFEQVFE